MSSVGTSWRALRGDRRRYPRAGSEKDRVDNALASADVIIDASASVAVSRHLSDLQTTKARRVGAFFNPAGTAVVVLTEAADRSVTLHDLEAQYCRLALTAPALEYASGEDRGSFC
jgi:hypothetical protein